ncbi:HAD family hydrolase [Actinomadura sp. SCN-SB]|uniref:HAD family hydrolase n=1 Tax=Actinomadura sp. SCN-SB TaxID=3373092 RepID=UPI003751CB75
MSVDSAQPPANHVKAVITDWGGVLTSPLKEAIAVWLAAERIDPERYRTVMRAWVTGAYGSGGPSPVHGLEDGSLQVAEFERLLAAELVTVDGGPVAAEGLINRMFGAFAPVEPMYEALRTARAAGLRTALLSNSWGNDYPRDLFADLFDAVVISAEVGMRKPDERIFRHALDLVGLPAEQCVFIDDIEHNIAAARALGMRAIHHTAVDTTLTGLRAMGLPV